MADPLPMRNNSTLVDPITGMSRDTVFSGGKQVSIVGSQLHRLSEDGISKADFPNISFVNALSIARENKKCKHFKIFS